VSERSTADSGQFDLGMGLQLAMPGVGR
jgi:hypothetical protein